MFEQQILGGILGFVTADALGVPVEFEGRSVLKADPVTGMRGYGTYNQPVGTWSDDSSMTLCTMESLTACGLNYEDIMEKFLDWANEGDMTPYGEVFDMGRTTREALIRYAKGTPALECGAASERENGNGSLMRILPIAFYLYHSVGPCFSKEGASYEVIRHVSGMTHAHPISLISCGIYCAVACHLLSGKELEQAISCGISDAKRYCRGRAELTGWLHCFVRVENEFLGALTEDEIRSSGYVLHTLEAALWCLLTTRSYAACVLKAVNLGSDTDTVAAVAGGLAGIYYGEAGIPKEWLSVIPKRDMIEGMCRDFAQKFPVG